MLQQELLDLLVDPSDHRPLTFPATASTLKGTNNSYPIEDNIPILLPEGAASFTKSTPQHEHAGTQFNYVDHYQKDGQLFDYFEEEEAPATIHEHRRLHEAILSALPSNALKILDVGCGNAWVAQQLCPKDKAVYSFDIALDNVKKALAKYPFEKHYGISGDVYHLPFKDNAFDALISAEVIEHVPDLHTYLSSMIRVVKPGGKIIISTPYNEKIMYSLCIHCNQPTPQHAHIHSFTEKKMEALLKRHPNIKYEVFAFSNKALLFLKTHILFKYLPFSFWRALDCLSNALIKKPTRLIAILTKV